MNISKNKIYIPVGKELKKKSLMLANLLATELANYGYSLDSEAHARITRQKPKKAKKFVCEILKEYTVGELNQPLFKNWEDRKSFTLEEFVCQILGYVFQFSGNDLYDPEFMERLKTNVGYRKTKKIKLISDQEFKAYFEKLVASQVSLDRKTSNKLESIFSYFEDEFDSLPRIKSAEIRIGALLQLSKNKSLTDSLLALKCDPIDVLRYSAAKKNFEHLKLPSDVLYSNLKWKERVEVFQFLNGFDFQKICESMGLNRGAWNKFLKHTHFFSQKGFITRFNDFYTAAFVSVGSRFENLDRRLKNIPYYIENNLVEVTESGNLAYRTFASRVMSAIEAKDWPRIKKVCIENRGYVLRNLMTISNGVQKQHQQDFINFVRDSISLVPVGVLFSILTIDINSEYRVIDVKGNTLVEKANYPSFIQDIQGDIKRHLNSKYGYSGKVEVSEKLKNNAVPFLSNNSELPRGTKIDFKNNKYLYFFVHWIQNKFRTDLDHSFECFDKDWNVETVYYGNQANSYIKQSGDITNAPAPQGATEYGRIDIAKIPEKIRYIVPTINVFSGEQFSDNEEARAGFMFSDIDRFSIDRREIVQYDLSQPAQYNMPFIMDVKNKQIIILDYNNRNRMGSTAHSYTQDIKNIISATKTKNYMTIGELGNLLSGDSEDISLEIMSKKSKKENILTPEELFSIFN